LSVRTERYIHGGYVEVGAPRRHLVHLT